MSGTLRTALALCLLGAVMMHPSVGRADDSKPGEARKPSPDNKKAFPTSAGAPVMPQPYHLTVSPPKFCSVSEKEYSIKFAEKLKIKIDAVANEARDYVLKMRAYIERERQSGVKDDIVSADESALAAFESQWQHDMTITVPTQIETYLETAKATPVENCSPPTEKIELSKAIHEGNFEFPPLPTGPVKPDAPAAPGPGRTATHSGVHHPAAPTTRKRAPSYSGVRPRVAPPPNVSGAIPKPPGAKPQDIQNIKVPAAN